MSKNLLKQILNELITLNEQQKLDSTIQRCIIKSYLQYLSNQPVLKQTLKNKINYPIQKDMDYYMLGFYLADLLSLH